ncbi:MATE family efflux transporter [Enterocloster citroniae]|uniref:MATE family efflux transporter n=1 Tax=Enterocloster citroniae TaxID=358743 RepID=UPI001D081C79|nr:MATE family efflux transporter [Enterocloster citroniae]MCB7065387.1 MATE family efflux transporter [Enterocloster citroniae]
MKDSFMKEKPVLPLLVSMALPMVISMLVNSLYNIVDSFFVARISEQAMTALSLVYPVQNLINAVAIGYGVGINALIAFYSGADDRVSVDTAATQGFLFAAIHGILITVGSISIMPAFLHMFTSDEGVIELGIQYSTIVFMFSLVIMIGLSFEKMFQSVGRMGMTMISMLCGCISNIILDPLLIFGIGFFPEMGIAGAAWATGIGQVITLAVYVFMYLARPIPVRIRRNYLKFNRSMDLKLYSIGIPAILNLALPSLLVSFLNGILALYSQSYVVILGIYYKLQTFLYLPANGIVQGMRPIIGYNYGAGEHKRVRRIYDMTLCMSCIIMVLGTVLCLTASKQLISLFTSNPETVLSGQKALRIISAGFIVSSVSVTSSGALEGLGKGTQSLIISLFRYMVIIIPAAFILCRIWGPVGVWSAFWITEFITAAISAVVYRLSIKLKQTN